MRKYILGIFCLSLFLSYGSAFSEVEENPPTLNLLSPTIDYFTSFFETTFKVHVSDETEIANVTLYANWSNRWHPVYVDSSGENNVDYSYTIDHRFDYINQYNSFYLNTSPISESGMQPTGIIFNGEYFWVADSESNKVYKYDLFGKRENIYEFDLVEVLGASTPRGMTSWGKDFWIIDNFNKYIFHVDEEYNKLNDGINISHIVGKNQIRDITTNGSDFWFVDTTDRILYHIDYFGNYIDHFSIIPNGVSLTTDGEYFWIADFGTHTLYTYNLEGELQSNPISLFHENATTISPATMTAGINTEINGEFPHTFYMADCTTDLMYQWRSTGKGTYTWGYQACDTFGNCGFSENRTISIGSEKEDNCYFDKKLWKYICKNFKELSLEKIAVQNFF